jgi:ATP-binding cassette subfamily C exporter for protease/lipase
MSLVIGVLVLAPSIYMFEVYGRVLNSRNEATLAWLLLAAVGIYAVLELLELARSRALRRASRQVAMGLAPRVLSATFDAGVRRHAGGRGQGPSDLRTVCEFIHSPAVTGALDVPAALLCLVLLYAMSVWVGALATVMVLVQVLIGVLQERLSARPYGEATRASAEAQVRAAGILRNAQVIESMGMGLALHRLWARSQARFMLGLSQASDRAGTATAATKLVSVIQGSLLLGLAVWLALDGRLAGGPGMAIVASILGARVLAPMSQVMGQWRNIGSVRSAYRRLAELLQFSPPQELGMALPAPQGMLVAEGLMATAPGTSVPILKGVSLGCRPGEMVAVIGPSGCGKSTLSRVLVGIWPSTGGKVRLDGADVHEWQKSGLGPHVGYLPQGVELFDGTVAENIARFDSVDLERVRRAADEAGILPLIASLPHGLDTRIGDGGVQLSGGQRQRIGLARAVYGDPRLVVLDEPNASLDEAGDQALMALLQRLKSRAATVVVITHRTQVLALADYVLLMNDGATSRFGPREEVLTAMRAATDRAATKAGRPAVPTATPAATPAALAAAVANPGAAA